MYIYYLVAFCAITCSAKRLIQHRIISTINTQFPYYINAYFHNLKSFSSFFATKLAITLRKKLYPFVSSLDIFLSMSKHSFKILLFSRNNFLSSSSMLFPLSTDVIIFHQFLYYSLVRWVNPHSLPISILPFVVVLITKNVYIPGVMRHFRVCSPG